MEWWRHLRKLDHHMPWGEVWKMNPDLVMCLDQFLFDNSLDFQILCGTQGVHSGKLHEQGFAVDFGVSCHKRRRFDVLIDLFRYPFRGIGVYPYGRYPKLKNPLALHCDMRPLTEQPFGVRKLWIGIPKDMTDRSQGNNYYGLNEENLKRFGVI